MPNDLHSNPPGAVTRNKAVFTAPPALLPAGGVDVSGNGRWRIWEFAGTKVDAPILGNGDMLYLSPSQNDPLRCQGAFLSTEETEAMMDWYRGQARDRGEHAREADILEMVRAQEGEGAEYESDEDAAADRDRLFREAAELCIQHQGGSTSLLQRRLRIGYGRAARIIDQLHHAGVLGPPDGSKPREVLLDLIQLDQVFPEE